MVILQTVELGSAQDHHLMSTALASHYTTELRGLRGSRSATGSRGAHTTSLKSLLHVAHLDNEKNFRALPWLIKQPSIFPLNTFRKIPYKMN